MNVDNVKELRNLLTEKNIDEMKYVIFTIRDDDMNELNVFKSKLKDKELYCCDIIAEDEMIINNYYYFSLEELINTIIVDFEIEE